MRLNKTRLKIRLNENRIDLSKILLNIVPYWNNRNLIEISWKLCQGFDAHWIWARFKQDLSWGCGIDSEELYKDWYGVQKQWGLRCEIYQEHFGSYERDGKVFR